MGSQLVGSLNSAQSPLWGLMWLTTFAAVIRPLALHLMQSGCACRKASRPFFQVVVL